MEETMKFPGYLVTLALAFGVLMFAAVDVQAAYRCGPNGCYHYYPHRSQWPVGGATHTRWHGGAPYGCAWVNGVRRCG
jgi:hypothetical protein